MTAPVALAHPISALCDPCQFCDPATSHGPGRELEIELESEREVDDVLLLWHPPSRSHKGPRGRNPQLRSVFRLYFIFIVAVVDADLGTTLFLLKDNAHSSG